MTTLSLLPHHHHDCSEAICLLPGYCGHEDSECDDKHEHDNCDTHHHHENSEEHCSLKVVDMSAAKIAEQLTPDSQPILLFFIVPESDKAISLPFESELHVQRKVVLPQLQKNPVLGLRAPPTIA